MDHGSFRLSENELDREKMWKLLLVLVKIISPQGFEDYKKLHANGDAACSVIMQDDFVESFVAGAPLIVLNNYLKSNTKQHQIKKSSLTPRHHQLRHTASIPRE